MYIYINKSCHRLQTCLCLNFSKQIHMVWTNLQNEFDNIAVTHILYVIYVYIYIPVYTWVYTYIYIVIHIYPSIHMYKLSLTRNMSMSKLSASRSTRYAWISKMSRTTLFFSICIYMCFFFVISKICLCTKKKKRTSKMSSASMSTYAVVVYCIGSQNQSWIWPRCFGLQTYKYINIHVRMNIYIFNPRIMGVYKF